LETEGCERERERERERGRRGRERRSTGGESVSRRVVKRPAWTRCDFFFFIHGA